MKSGMLAAETIMSAIEKEDFSGETLGLYGQKVADSWINQELYAARNFSQALSKKGGYKIYHNRSAIFERWTGIQRSDAD